MLEKLKSINWKKLLLFIPLVVTGIVVYILVRNKKSINDNLIDYLSRRTKQDVNGFNETKHDFNEFEVTPIKEKQDEIINENRSMSERIDAASGPEELTRIAHDLRQGKPI